MKIGSVQNVRALYGGKQARVPQDKQEPTDAVAKTDSVLISEKARELLAKLADEALASGSPNPQVETNPETDGLRMDKIRQAMARIREGYYDRPEVKQQIAGKLADEFRKPPDEPKTPE